MGFPLPAGILNTSSEYFYADTTNTLGPLIKDPGEQVLVVVDYTGQLAGPIISEKYTADISSNPPLVVAYPTVDPTGMILSFLVTGGIQGQQYNISIVLNMAGAGTRTDLFTVDIPSQGDCACAAPAYIAGVYSTAPAANPFVNIAPRYFYGTVPPTVPVLMDFWFNTENYTLYMWSTDGAAYFWTPIGVTDLSIIPQTQINLYYIALGAQQVFPLDTLDMFNNGTVLVQGATIEVYRNGARLTPDNGSGSGGYTANFATNSIVLSYPAGQGELIAIDVGLPVGSAPAASVAPARQITEVLTVTATNTFGQPLSFAPDMKSIWMNVDGTSVFAIGADPAFQVSGKNVTWISTIYSVFTTSNVIITYTY